MIAVYSLRVEKVASIPDTICQDFRADTALKGLIRFQHYFTASSSFSSRPTGASRKHIFISDSNLTNKKVIITWIMEARDFNFALSEMALHYTADSRFSISFKFKFVTLSPLWYDETSFMNLQREA